MVGFGPVGQLAALLLGRLGVRVTVFERAAGPFGAPAVAPRPTTRATGSYGARGSTPRCTCRARWRW